MYCLQQTVCRDVGRRADVHPAAGPASSSSRIGDDVGRSRADVHPAAGPASSSRIDDDVGRRGADVHPAAGPASSSRIGDGVRTTALVTPSASSQQASIGAPG